MPPDRRTAGAGRAMAPGATRGPVPSRRGAPSHSSDKPRPRRPPAPRSAHRRLPVTPATSQAASGRRGDQCTQPGTASLQFKFVCEVARRFRRRQPRAADQVAPCEHLQWSETTQSGVACCNGMIAQRGSIKARVPCMTPVTALAAVRALDRLTPSDDTASSTSSPLDTPQGLGRGYSFPPALFGWRGVSPLAPWRSTFPTCSGRT